MGSVMDYIDCPNCGREAFSDYYYKTGEEYVHCSDCGYHYSATIKNRNKPLNKLLVEDWEIKEVKNPYGAFRLRFEGEVGFSVGTVNTEQDWIELKERVLEESKTKKVHIFVLSQYSDGAIVKTTIFGSDIEDDTEDLHTEEDTNL